MAVLKRISNITHSIRGKPEFIAILDDKANFEANKKDNIVTSHFICAMHVASDLKKAFNQINYHMREEPTLQKMLLEQVQEMMRLLHIRYPELKLEKYI